jgi:methylglutaconyl-CoA hydratase
MGADTTNDAVRCRVDGRGVARVVLDQPDNRNALSQALVGGLLDAVDRCDESDVRVIVLGHTPPVFCAGADLRERRDGRIDSSGFVEVLQRLMTHRCPTIAAVEGPVRAGGIGLMAACDLVVVRPDTTFAFTEVRIGVAPAIISVPILERVPWTRLAAPFLTGEPFGATDALGMGLVTHVTDEVGAAIDALVDGVLAGGPNAVAATKKLLRSQATDPGRWTAVQRLSESLFASAEGAEGMRAFAERRPPSWAVAPEAR